MGRKAVILLKSSSTDDPTLDPYYKALEERGYSAHFVPVLEDGFCNEDDLDEVLLAGPSSFSGVIVTSGRAVKAWECSAQRIRDKSVTLPEYGWTKTPFYAVGPKTAAQMRSMSSNLHLPPALCPSDIRGAEISGTGERLAHFIVTDLAGDDGRPRPNETLLFLTGDKTSPSIPNILQEAGIAVEKLQVYETRSSSTFEEDFRETIASIHDEHIAWVAFFSPSGARTSLPTLRSMYALDTITTDASPRPRVRLAAIGPTTASYLRHDCQLVVHGMAEKPDPTALAASISEYDEKHPS